MLTSGPRNKDTIVAKSIPRTQILVPKNNSLVKGSSTLREANGSRSRTRKVYSNPGTSHTTEQEQKSQETKYNASAGKLSTI